MSVRITPVGTRGLMVDLPDLATVMNWHAFLKANPLPRQTDVIAAARTVLLTFDSPTATREAADRLASISPSSAEQRAPRDVEIAVLYDGADTASLAESLHMSVDELIAWHTSTTWVAAFGGFAPGFTYCVPEDPARALSVPRLTSPRTEVPAGAVAVAGEFSAVYPRTSPGGWQLIGTTHTPMWDSAATPPALVAPGDRVHYRAVDALEDATETSHYHLATPPRRPIFSVDDPGMQTLYQDLGRQGNGNLGVTTSGSADRASARTANAAVGNKRNATLLENIGGLTLTALAETVICVTGADADVTVGGRPALLATPTIVPAGAEVVVAPARLGMRTYIAVRGGLIADTELDSAATDMLSGLGPDPIRAGDTIAMSLTRPQSANALLSNPLRVRKEGATTTGTVRVVLGPRDDWFSPAAIEQFLSTTYTVTAESNRVGLRLDSEQGLERARTEELPSEGMVAGSVQIPPSGQPVVFLRDHAVTGGYPVIATVINEDVDIATQLPPGGTIRFELFEEKND
ncbi:allophanate hydrolase [Corynebacterium hadale]|uniref:Allophanate hydrolase n=2 Tax=Corynebacterium TaxID=1716 RepID=A0ABX4H9A6_9CORY|nr:MULTISPECIES: urea amidolyase family protein [Corynebacterium]PAT05897.1 allophanate hydrolase [Corynebacterium hadale]PAT15369.1 allophanate hydrolase [Corynebacterium sp. NML 120412]RMD20460.1 carboxyltransferase domain-containing protein [Corynebacterium gottingense]WJZ12698.1 KipI antagonist [Corynebacterium gottingense]WJZ15023.1 KipI antagonist [Corynebacterium gottingense]